MRTYLGAAIACLTLMLTGIARADHFSDFNSQCNARNKSVFLDYQVCSDDLNNHQGNNGKNDNQGGNGDCNNGGNNSDPGNNICPPPVDNGGGCDTDNNNGCGDNHGCDPKPPCPPPCPHDPAVVPLPASSALGGVGLAALALIGWVKSRRVARA